jgi:hypothetical protein
MTLKTVALGIGMVAIAAGGVWAMRAHLTDQWASPSGTWTAPTRPDDREGLTADAARTAREGHYQNFRTLAQARALPSDFARKEAMYALAGRADARDLRDLIAEANRIVDQSERLDALEILLARYVEVDPQAALRSALNLDRTASAELVPGLIGVWSRSDLAAAATASQGLPTQVLKTAAAQAILARHAAGDPQEVRQLAKKLGIPAEAEHALFEAREGQALADPHQAMQSALALGNSVQQQTEVMAIASAWARIAPEEAWDYAAALTDPAARLAFQQGVIDVWAAEQPAVAFARVAELPPDWQRTQLLREATAELAHRDPRLAVELVRQTQGQEFEQLQNLVASEWAKTDPSGAALWVEAQARGVQSRLAYQVAPAYVTQKPDEALAWALRISRSPGRNLWSYMVGLVAERDPEAALQLALSAEIPAQRNQAVAAVIGSIAARDPATAMSHVERLPPGQLRMQALMQIGTRLADTSPERSLDWLKGLEDAQSRAQLAQTVVNRIAQRDDELAVRLLDRVPEDLRTSWIRGISNAYVTAGDFERSMQWVRRFENEPFYASLVGNLVSRVPPQNADAAFELISKIPDVRRRDQFLSQSLTMLAMTSPETAAKGAERISGDRERNGAIANIAGNWAQRDYAEARKWALSLDADKGRDEAVGRIAANQKTSTDEALSLIAQMRSPEARSSAIFNKAASLARSNPEEARSLLRRYPLDPARQQRIQKMLEAGPGDEREYYWYAGDR